MTVPEKRKIPFFLSMILFGVKLLTHLRLHFSHLIEHTFMYSFGDAVSPMNECNAEIEDTEHFILCCHFYSTQRFELSNNFNKIVLSFKQLDTKK